MRSLICTYVFIVLCTFSAHAQDQEDPPKVAYLKEKDTVTGLEVKPEFPGGVGAFYNQINKKFKIPNVKQNITARIYLSFVIEKDGTMSSYKVLKDPGYGLADELIRVLKLIKDKWSPGMQKGKPVRASYNLPLTINIKD